MHNPREIKLEQNSEEWLNFRRSKIGASDTPIIMGVSPWKTPYQLWQEKLGLKAPDAMNEAMRKGRDNEEKARADFEKVMRIKVYPKVFQHPIYDWSIASLDCCTEDGSIIGEIKCPGIKDHEIAASGNIPEKYYPQLQKQMFVMGAERNFYFSWYQGCYHIVEIARDEKYIQEMLKKEIEFYECMINLTSPKLSQKDYVNRNDDEWNMLSKDYINLENEINSLSEKKESIRKNLLKMCDNHNCRGGGLSISKILKKGGVDYESIPQLKSVNLNEYRKNPIEYWVIKKESNATVLEQQA